MQIIANNYIQINANNYIQKIFVYNYNTKICI